MRQPKQVVMAASFAVALFAQSHAGAAGFALIEHSAQGMGNAFAGGGAAAGDTSTVWFNPASMAALPAGTQFQATGHVIVPEFSFTDQGSVQAIGANTVPLLPGSLKDDDGGTVALVPNLYYKRDLSDDLAFGIALNVPFGLATEYKTDWVGRYQAVESEIKTFNLNPAVSLRAGEYVTWGFGVSAMYMDAKLTNAIDFNAACFGALAPAVIAGSGLVAPAAIPTAVNAACAPGGTPGSGGRDGFIDNEADGWGYGFNVGVLFEPSDRTRLSVAYRSQVVHELDGRARFTVPANIASGAFGAAINGAAATTFADDRISAKVKLPDTLSASAWHSYGDWEVMGDVTWTGWSKIPELRITFDNPTTAGGPGVETLNWEDTFRVSLGTAYSPNKQWKLRAGVAYDESPIPNATSRTPRLPDNDRIWVSLGASYNYSEQIALDVGYSHLFINDTRIQRTGGSAGNVLIGEYESNADIFSAQVRMSW